MNLYSYVFSLIRDLYFVFLFIDESHKFIEFISVCATRSKSMSLKQNSL